MMRSVMALFAVVGLSLGSAAVRADEFTDADLKRWQEQFDGVVKEGRALWTDGKLGKNISGTRPTDQSVEARAGR